MRISRIYRHRTRLEQTDTTTSPTLRGLGPTQRRPLLPSPPLLWSRFKLQVGTQWLCRPRCDFVLVSVRSEPFVVQLKICGSWRESTMQGVHSLAVACGQGWVASCNRRALDLGESTIPYDWFLAVGSWMSLCAGFSRTAVASSVSLHTAGLKIMYRTLPGTRSDFVLFFRCFI